MKKYLLLLLLINSFVLANHIMRLPGKLIELSKLAMIADNITKWDIATVKGNLKTADYICDRFLQDNSMDKAAFTKYIKKFQLAQRGMSAGRHAFAQELLKRNDDKKWPQNFVEERSEIMKDCQHCKKYKKEIADLIALCDKRITEQKK